MKPTPTDSIFWPYLEPLLERHRASGDITYIGMSDANGMDRLVESSRSEDVYPGIFVMRPKYIGNIIDNAALIAQFDVLLFVFQNCQTDDYDNQDEAFNHAEYVVAEIVKDLQHHRFEGRNFFDFNSVRIEPVMYQTGVDSASGYELKLKLGLIANSILC